MENKFPWILVLGLIILGLVVFVTYAYQRPESTLQEGTTPIEAVTPTEEISPIEVISPTEAMSPTPTLGVDINIY